MSEHQSHTAEDLRGAQASVVRISVPGEYAWRGAKALKAGRHVFLFSSGVTLKTGPSQTGGCLTQPADDGRE
jgi:hypothetical protein